MFKSNKKVVLTSFLALILSGCVGTSERSLIYQNTFAKKVVSSEQSIIRREKLVNLLVENFAIQDYLDMAANISNNSNEAFSKCVITDSTYSKTEAVLKKDLYLTISSLTDNEVIQYINYVKRDDARLFRKFNKSIYSTAETNYLDNSDSLTGEVISFYQGLDMKDMGYLKAVSNLPNEDVRIVLFPLDFPNINLTLAGESISDMKEAVESSC